MNITLLEDICKKECRSSFEWFKYTLVNNPFGLTNKGVVEDAINNLNIDLGTSIS